MTLTMTPEGRKLLGAIRRNFELLEELKKTAPADVDFIFGLMVTHIRSTHPQAIRDAQLDEVGRG